MAIPTAFLPIKFPIVLNTIGLPQSILPSAKQALLFSSLSMTILDRSNEEDLDVVMLCDTAHRNVPPISASKSRL